MGMELPVLETRKVLLDNLLAKVSPLCSTKLLAKEILLEIANNLQNKDIIELLQNERTLLETVYKSNAYANEKDELGEQLYVKVTSMEPELSSKITGMLLELETNTIKQLLSDEDLLIKAVEKSKKEYFEYLKAKQGKEELGERLYDLICQNYPSDISSHLTGMLLELDEDVLESLIKNREELDKKLSIAYEAYKNYKTQNLK